MVPTRTTKLSGWGGYPRVFATVSEPGDLRELEATITQPLIMRGQGRSYGDAAISDQGLVVLSERTNAIFSLDENGLLTAESGATLDDILKKFVARGWFPPVVPGTKFVSLGGCIAADIHGKNHHREGSFGTHIKEFELLLADSSHKICSPVQNKELFWATVGGMGLTGVITKAALQMSPIESPFMIVRHHQADDLAGAMQLLEDRSLDDEYSVVWVDCLARGRRLGRSVLITGHHAKVSELPATVSKSLKLRQSLSGSQRRSKAFDLKFDFPEWVLNRYSVSAFNEAYFRRQGLRKKPFIQHYDNFFFPLDRIGNWNRMYGRRGFVQYQCVFPLATAEEGLQLVLEELARHRRTSFLSVLKLFGPGNQGMLSFPTEGFTLTLDLPLSNPGLLPFLDQLDQIVLNRSGRVYLAKDARMKAETFRPMYPRIDEWLAIKSRVDPENRFESNLARRLELTSVPREVAV